MRSFQKLLGVTPREYADSLRLKTFKHELKESANVTHALYAAGYSSSSRVYEKASPQLGMTPLTYRNGGEGLAIRYTIGDSDLGQVLLAATDKGVCAIKLGDSALLIADLRDEFPTPRSLAMIANSAHGSPRSSVISQDANPTCAFRSTFVPPLFSGRSGKRFNRFLTARPPATLTSLSQFASRAPFAPLRMLAPVIQFV